MFSAPPGMFWRWSVGHPLLFLWSLRTICCVFWNVCQWIPESPVGRRRSTTNPPRASWIIGVCVPRTCRVLRVLLRVRRPHRIFDLIPVRSWNTFEWSNKQVLGILAYRRRILFKYESCFHPFITQTVTDPVEPETLDTDPLCVCDCCRDWRRQSGWKCCSCCRFLI